MEEASVGEVNEPHRDFETHGKSTGVMGFHRGKVDDLIEVFQVFGIGKEVNKFAVHRHIQVL